MRHAADNLTPLTLELGGKSPCIVDDTAKIELAAKRIVFGKFLNCGQTCVAPDYIYCDEKIKDRGKSPCIVDDTAKIELAAKRIVFGKFLNCGQTCVAPDYIYCDEKIKDRLINEIVKQIEKQFGKKPLLNGNYGKIINEKHFNRILSLIDEEKTVFGGECEENGLRIEPTVMDNVKWNDAVMQEEIFGPVLPILTFKNIGEAVKKINSMAHPLALYIFSENKRNIKYVTERCAFGGGCVNDTIIHLATSNMAFGGVGESGMGGYHGKAGFEAFSHKKSIVDKKTWMDLPFRYQPYKQINEKIIKMFLR